MELLEWVSDAHQKVIVVLGVPAVPGMRHDPLDFAMRYRMLAKVFPEFLYVALRDTKYDDTWSTNLDTAILPLLSPGQTVCLYGARDSFIKHYTGKFLTQELAGDTDVEGWSGTKERAALRVPVRDTSDFRAGVIWHANNHWPRIHPTVDMAVMQDEQILLGRKPDEVLWRFPGGFADAKNLSYEGDALREVHEETSLNASNTEYIGSTLINDWRYTDSHDRIKTMLFVVTSLEGTAIAGDDLAETRWFDRVDVRDTMLVDTHKVLLRMLVEKGRMPKCCLTT